MGDIRTHVDAMFRAESGRILATLIRLLGDFDLAEDVMHDAILAKPYWRFCRKAVECLTRCRFPKQRLLRLSNAMWAGNTCGRGVEVRRYLRGDRPVRRF